MRRGRASSARVGASRGEAKRGGSGAEGREGRAPRGGEGAARTGARPGVARSGARPREGGGRSGDKAKKRAQATQRVAVASEW
jgi:hypothetical protein